MFNQPDLVRDMQRELDQIIQEGIVQLTKLLKNSETGISSGTAVADDDQFTMNRQKQNYLRETKLSGIGRGRLTERLLAQGILTPTMLQELKKEWNRKAEKAAQADEDPRKPRRKRKLK
nr:unnamed protein product [Callosobruchus chinensis]